MFITEAHIRSSFTNVMGNGGEVTLYTYVVTASSGVYVVLLVVATSDWLVPEKIPIYI